MEKKVNAAMAIVAMAITFSGMAAASAPMLPMEIRHIAGGFLAAGILMLLTNAVIGFIIRD